MKNILSNKDALKKDPEGIREKFIREHIYKFDGKSCERVIEVIRNDLLS